MQGKKILTFLVGLGVLALAVLLVVYGYDDTWRLWNIPTMSPPFADLRTITGGAESARMGLDPLVDNPGDPWGRPMDYPRIWESLFLLGIDQGDTALLALIMIAAFIAGLFLFVRDIDRTTAVLLAAGIFSPAVLLGIERGNNDLLIFFLMAAALAALRRSPVLATGLVTFGAALMYFPIFGLAILLALPRRRCLALAGLSIALILVYAAATLSDLRHIGTGALRGTTISYGFNVLHTSVHGYFRSPATGLWLEYACLGVLLVMFGIALRTRGFRFAPAEQDHQHLDAFRLGAAIYVGTFLIGNNWDYRLMFLLFTIPQLDSWRRFGGPPLGRAAGITLAAVMASLWLQFFFRFAHLVPYGGHLVFGLDELANWVTLGGLLYLLPRSAPAWLFRRPGGLGSPSPRAPAP
ncbi:MAG: glycosyltransferase 87 family protein [bacterium]